MTLRMKAAATAALLACGLENDFAVWFCFGGELNHAVEHLIKLVVFGLEGKFLCHKVHGDGFDALEPGELVLKLASAVGAVDFVELDGFLSCAGGIDAGRTVALLDCYSQIWLMP